jgi:hypothetical protein
MRATAACLRPQVHGLELAQGGLCKRVPVRARRVARRRRRLQGVRTAHRCVGCVGTWSRRWSKRWRSAGCSERTRGSAGGRAAAARGNVQSSDRAGKTKRAAAQRTLRVLGCSWDNWNYKGAHCGNKTLECYFRRFARCRCVSVNGRAARHLSTTPVPRGVRGMRRCHLSRAQRMGVRRVALSAPRRARRMRQVSNACGQPRCMCGLRQPILRLGCGCLARSIRSHSRHIAG